MNPEHAPTPPDKEAPTPQEVLPEDDATLGPDDQPLTYDELSDGF